MSSITIRCPKDKENPFSLVSKKLIRLSEKVLSLEARALLIYLLSFPPTYVFRNPNVMKELGMNPGRFYNIYNELRKAGYILRETYLEGNLKRYNYVFSEEPREEFRKAYEDEESKNSKNFTDTSVSDTSKADTSKTDVLINIDRVKMTKTHGSSNHSSLKLERSHSDQRGKDSSEGTVPPLVGRFQEEAKEKEEFLESTGIEMRKDTKEVLARKYSIMELRDAFSKFLKTKQRMKKIQSEIAVYRSLLDSKISGVPGSMGDDNTGWLRKFIEQKGISFITFCKNFVRNNITGDEISLEINPVDFKFAISSWV